MAEGDVMGSEEDGGCNVLSWGFQRLWCKCVSLLLGSCSCDWLCDWWCVSVTCRVCLWRFVAV